VRDRRRRGRQGSGGGGVKDASTSTGVTFPTVANNNTVPATEKWRKEDGQWNFEGENVEIKKKTFFLCFF
jgi:hypothetical protein